MDELDTEIVRLLQTDARQSNRELARTLGIAPSTCLERVRALTRRGVIRGYHAEISPAALNRGVQALVSLQVRPLNRTVINTFKDYVSGMAEVIGVFVVAAATTSSCTSASRTSTTCTRSCWTGSASARRSPGSGRR